MLLRPMIMPRRFVATTLLLASASLVSACGHPATKEECEVIVDRIVEIELREQGVTDPAKIEDRKKETRASVGNAEVANCIGKKVRDSALTCIKSATTVKQIQDVCLR